MITEDTLKHYQARVAALKADIKKHPNPWQLKDDLRVYQALVRRAKVELGWPVCRDSGCNSEHVFEVGDGEWACTRHGGWPPAANRKHTVTKHIPRPCPYDQANMERTDRGLKCPNCGHEVFDVISAATSGGDHCLHLIVTASTVFSIRLEVWLRRKPNLYVNFVPMSTFWCVASDGDKPIMQTTFSADFSHDDPEQDVLLIDGYPEGTRPKLPFRDHFGIAPDQLVTPRRLDFFVVPVIGKEGTNWTGRFVFVDQWRRKYKTKKIELMWAGGKVKNAAENL